MNNKHTLNPAQITAAIENGQMKNVCKAHGYSVTTDECDDYHFEIDGEVYYCNGGKVHVQYDFELSESLRLKLRLKALQEGLESERERMKEIQEKLAQAQEEYDTINKQKEEK